MQTIAIISQKGGSGKTTITLNLAIAAAKRGKQVAVIDLDPQQSASRWSRLRSAENPVIVGGHGPNLATLLERAKDGGADIAFIDTAPKSENAALTAARLSDLVIIPCQPSNLDLDAIADTINIANLAKRPTLFVLNNCRASSALPDQAAEALAEYKAPVADVRLGNRVAFVKSLADGKGVVESEPHGAAAREVERLHATVQHHVKKAS
ncbi:MAG: ParA family protein [Proteobacteria bacterium]|nr:ParA family protein [Pseudomonadota bacterium]